MRALSYLLIASGSLLAMAGCLPDFSPDPLKRDIEEALPDSGPRADAGDASRPRDAGGGARDASGRDAGQAEPPADGASTPDEDAGSDPVATPDAGGEDADPPPPGCDLRGRYFLNEHLTTNVLNALQVANNWYYVELTQNGSELAFAVAVSCGANVEGASDSLPAKSDDSLAWPAYLTQPTYAGRKGTVTPTADGCDVDIEQGVVVRGATVATYRDLSVPLPTKAQRASNGSPGWEDWDEDGNPGVSLVISGLASGTMFVVTRQWSEYDGSIPKNATTFQLHFEWDQTRSNLGTEPANAGGVLGINAGRDPDESKQFVELAKLNDEQAEGDDAARCERLRGLAATLTPNAAKL